MKALFQLEEHFRPLAEVWVEVCRDVGLNPTVTSTKRTYKEQYKLYDDYVSGRSRYPAAKPGLSMHEWGLAFDMTTEPHQALEILGPLWEKLGGRWGGRFKPKRDEIHFEAPMAIKTLAGWKPGAFAAQDAIEKKDPVAAAASAVKLPWWSGILPKELDPFYWAGKID